MTKNEWIDSVIFDLYQNGYKEINKNDPEFIVAKQEMLTKGIIKANDQFRNMNELTPLGFEIAEFGLPYELWIRYKNGILDVDSYIIKDRDDIHSDFLEELIPLQNSQQPQNVAPITNFHVGIWLVKKFKKLSIATIIEMIIAALIAAYVIYYFGFNKIR